MKNRSKVSSRDVAREAGVSQATVSYVLNDAKGIKIKPETREAVLEAVKKLNYHPNHIARGMKLNKSMSIGVVTDRNVTNFYFMKILEGIKDGTQPYNYSITLMFNRQEDVANSEYIKYYNSNRLDGIIFAFSYLDDESVSYLNDKGIPFVIADSNPTGRGVYEVYGDHLSHIDDVVAYFKKAGVRRMAYTGPRVDHKHDRRVEAIKNSVRIHGIEMADEHIVFSSFDDNEIFEATKKLFEQNNRPDAIITGSPKFGMIAVKCASIEGLKIPEEFKVIAIGSSNFFTVINPALSSLELPLYEIGIHSAQKLFDIMNGHPTDKTTVLTSQLVIRGSS